MARTRLDSNRTQIGTSDLYVRPFVLGGNVFGWTADSTESFDVLDEFVARGGDFIDTADGYSHWVSGHRGGESETILGEWFVSRPRVRDQVVLATKVSTHPDYSGLSAVNVRAAADASLQRLRTNVIDLYYAHFDDLDTPLEETVAAFSGLVDAGKVRAIGVSNYTADRVDEWFRIARAGGYHLPVALEPHYNLMERGFETNGLRSVAAREHLAVFPYYALASGFLAGKYRTGSDTSASGASPRAAGSAGTSNADAMYWPRWIGSPQRTAWRSPLWRWRGCGSSPRSPRRSRVHAPSNSCLLCWHQWTSNSVRTNSPNSQTRPINKKKATGFACACACLVEDLLNA